MRAKKSLGQHFLRSKSAVRTLVEALSVTPKELVIEIGPGKGVLTAALLESGAQVIAIEKDPRMTEYLENVFQDFVKSKQLKIAAGDILEQPPKEFAHGKKFKVIGNIPYYITGAILREVLEDTEKPTQAVFLVQKEVAARIARGEKESILSLSVKAFGAPKYITTVKRALFSPAPRVDSAIIAITNIENKLGSIPTTFFFKVVKAGFASPRKQALSNLKRVFSGEVLLTLFKKEGLDLKVRAEDIPFPKWKALSLGLMTTTKKQGILSE